MKVEIDLESGFCFGVLSAIGKAEEELRSSDELYCLGDIVHNGIFGICGARSDNT